MSIVNFNSSLPVCPCPIKPTKLFDLIDTLREYNKKFSSDESMRSQEVLGAFERIDLPINSKICVNSDIHGSYIDLAKRIEAWQQKGYLDDNLCIKEEWRGRILFVFLGDYVDRGPNSWECVEKLIELKMKNPDEVCLLRGNHEDRRISVGYMAPQSAKDFYKNKDFWHEIEHFFCSLPLGLIAGSGKEYAVFTHGSIHIDEDLNDILENPNQRHKRKVELKAVALSQRILSLLPVKLRHRKLGYISEAEILAYKDETKKSLSWLRSALRIQDFILKFGDSIRLNDRQSHMSSLTWGDINSQEVSGPNTFRGKGVKLSPRLIKDYFDVVSSEFRQIKVLFKGHGHFEKTSSLEREEFIFMLPVAGGLEVYDSVRKTSQDISYVLTTENEMSKWILEKMIRERNEPVTTFSSPMLLYPRLRQPESNSDSSAIPQEVACIPLCVEPRITDVDEDSSSDDGELVCHESNIPSDTKEVVFQSSSLGESVFRRMARSQTGSKKRSIFQVKEKEDENAVSTELFPFLQKFKLKRT